MLGRKKEKIYTYRESIADNQHRLLVIFLMLVLRSLPVMNIDIFLLPNAQMLFVKHIKAE
jgi:hypothetical protein